MNDKWLNTRIEELRALKTPSAHQRLLLALAALPNRDPANERKFLALARSEWALERAMAAKSKASAIVHSHLDVVEKLLRREIDNAAKLLVMAGLVDAKTGVSKWGREELLGALLDLAEGSHGDDQRSNWKLRGQAVLADLKSKRPAAQVAPGIPNSADASLGTE